ncbi:MAG: proteasome accessory factor PafA2 [Acidobacteria bacterium]|nr:proteasome accessory factor PafA2 [Acidobacteriota bacterium]
MSLPKVLGIETEYGISGGPDGDPVLASSHVVNAFARQGQRSVNWDFTDESPGVDARNIPILTSVAPLIETHLANTVLTNGARFYVDHAHPEYSSPECRTPREAVLYDVVGENVLRHAVSTANSLGLDGAPLVVYKNNSDGKGNSYGTHENYLVSRSVEFPHIVRAMAVHFLSRQIFCGSGKVGWETDVLDDIAPTYQIAQRSEFFEELVGLETTLKRPIVNTRDEPHGDPERFRRLHVIAGDANMSQTATFLKLGSTALLLAALEEIGIDGFPALPRFPVRAIRTIGCDPSLRVAVDCDDGIRRTAWDYQDALWHLAERYVDQFGGECVATDGEVRHILSQWRDVLDGLRDDRDSVADRVDWVAKLRLIDGMRDRYDLAPDDPRLAAIDLQYHDIRVEKSLAYRAGLQELVSSEEVALAEQQPPRETRAYFRGRCVDKYRNSLVAANWDSLVFDLGEDPLHRVPMMDPLKGTAALTESLLDSSDSAADLLHALGMV